MNQSNSEKDQHQFENIFGNIPTERLSKNLSENIVSELDAPKPKKLTKKEKWFGFILSAVSIGLISFLAILFIPSSNENKSDSEGLMVVICIILLAFLIALLYFLRQLRQTNSTIEKIQSK